MTEYYNTIKELYQNAKSEIYVTLMWAAMGAAVGIIGQGINVGLKRADFPLVDKVSSIDNQLQDIHSIEEILADSTLNDNLSKMRIRDSIKAMPEYKKQQKEYDKVTDVSTYIIPTSVSSIIGLGIPLGLYGLEIKSDKKKKEKKRRND